MWIQYKAKYNYDIHDVENSTVYLQNVK